MGMSIDAMLIYGISYKDIPEELIEQVDELLDDGELYYASPYYDSPKKKWIVGISVAYYDLSACGLSKNIAAAALQLEETILQGLSLGFHVSPHVT